MKNVLSICLITVLSFTLGLVFSWAIVAGKVAVDYAFEHSLSSSMAGAMGVGASMFVLMSYVLSLSFAYSCYMDNKYSNS